MTVQRYQRRPNLVDAVRLTDANAERVADWADGRTDREPQTGKLFVRLPQTAIPAVTGDWIVRDVMPDGLGPARAMQDHLFAWCFEQSGGHYRRRD